MDGLIHLNGKIIIPVRNEEESIPHVIRDIQGLNLINDRSIIVVDNGSTDKTASVLEEFEITYLFEPEKGYGNACKKALDYISSLENKPEWIIFMDGDRSDFAGDIPVLLHYFKTQNADFITGDRTGFPGINAGLQDIQRFGNTLICYLLNLISGVRFRDLGPLRLIRYNHLVDLNLKDRTWGWNLEMNIKAIHKNLKILEVPVRYRNRYSGKSKISGNWKMILPVGFKILITFMKHTRNKKF